jgi:hypothetical protein
MKLNTSSLFYAAGIAGLVAGFGSAAPLLSLLNCLLCGWFWLGGAGAVWLYNKREPQNLDAGRGALVGAAAGLVAAIVVAVLSIALSGMGFAAASFDDPQIRPYLDQFGGEAAVAAFVGAGALVCTTIFSVGFGALGGLIGASIFKKK